MVGRRVIYYFCERPNKDTNMRMCVFGGWLVYVCVYTVHVRISCVCVFSVCACMCGWRTGCVQRASVGWWKPAAACLFSELTCCWLRRAQAGMWGTRLILHLPHPEIEALFLSVCLSICFWRSHTLETFRIHRLHIRQSDVFLQTDRPDLMKKCVALCRC